MRFQVTSRQGRARTGRLETAHGAVDTPAFMPVGTLGAVKGLGPVDLAALGARVMLSNLYHLALRPGIDVIEKLGGLHAFTGWPGVILTDSGGYQVFSLTKLRQIDDDGVRFRSHLDGAPVELTPESVVRSQERMGVDIAMVLDECPPWPVEEAEAEMSLHRTHRWAERSVAARASDKTAVFGIVQGSFYPRLRAEAVAQLSGLDFDGFAVGGVSVGEPRDLGRAAVEQVVPELPETKPRYLMGLGTPADLVHGIRNGVDLFDCVLPARNARHGHLYTRSGEIRIKNARFRDDPRPLDDQCSCPVCSSVSRAFLHHLMRSGEITARVLATVHNLRFYLDFVADLRDALASGSFEDSAARVAHAFASDDPGGQHS